MEFDMGYPIVTCKPNTSWIYMAAEAIWILSGENSLFYSQEIQRIQAPYSDDGKKLSGAYGPSFQSQLPYILDLFARDINTRQAVLTIWKRSPKPSKDIPCTVALQWLIRNNKLHCIVTMRSSDVGMGLPYDMFSFACMSAEIASKLGVELGICYITAGSRHIYDNQIATLKDLPITVAALSPNYEKLVTWKWPAYKEVLRTISKYTWTNDIERADAQLMAKTLICGGELD
jgi:thymidylate synthase